MSIQNTNFDRIEAYLLGQMPAAESAEFERNIAEDTALADEVEQQRLEHRAMELLLREELKSNLNSWKAEKESVQTIEGGTKTVSIGSTRQLLFRLAAAASVLLVIGFFSRQYFTGIDEEALAMQYFEGSNIASRGDATSPLSPAYDAMSRQDWSGALTALDQVKTEDFRQTVMQLRGECYFRLKEYTASASAFRQLLDAGVPADMRDKVEWQLLTAYVAEGKHPKEQGLLLDQVLSKKGHLYYGKAMELKGKMD